MRHYNPIAFFCFFHSFHHNTRVHNPNAIISYSHKFFIIIKSF